LRERLGPTARRRFVAIRVWILQFFVSLGNVNMEAVTVNRRPDFVPDRWIPPFLVY